LGHDRNPLGVHLMARYLLSAGHMDWFLKTRTASLLAAFLTTLPALAHPGHYHPPGEEDEFDTLLADWFHLHGWLEAGLALAALAAVLVFRASSRRSVRFAAALTFGAGLALIAAI
jgi:hypothetical protein